MLEARLLGKFDVRRDGKLVAIPSRPAQSLFAYLILTAGTSHRREKLAGLLWPDSTEESARDYFRHGLWKLRKAIELESSKEKSVPYILADDIHVSFNPESKYSLDAVQIDRVKDSASTDELITALSLYEGELLPGFYDEWVVLEREHLQAIFESKMARLLALLQDEDRWLDVLKWGERWISFGQKPEPAYRALMFAHAAKGDMSKVASVYERCVKSLKQFGVEPSEQTAKLYEELKAGQGVPAAILLREQKQDKAKKEASRSSNLPVPLTSFIGREKEVADIVRLLGKNRLLTLTGSGGVGKTRLAIEAGNKLLPKFKDGVWWVDLVGLTDPSLVSQEVAKVVGAREVPNQPMIETLVKHLGSKQLLLVLDNCEHLITACAQLADRLLSACKNLKILATSREALDILGETAFHVPSLTLPEIGETLVATSLNKFESVRLFGERAASVQPAFKLNDQNAKAVAQICRRLSGMPLAIELAAARVRMMTVDEIAKRLDDRFDLLTSGNRAALPRHQTLRATIDWSYDLLTEPERTLFRRLAVFASGFALEAAEAVCGYGELKRNEIVDLLGRLVDKSLVFVDAALVSSGTRYRLLETVREYALGKLEGAEPATVIRDRHLEFFTKFAEETEPHLYAPEQVEWFAHAEAEIDNMRAALDWSTIGMENGNDARIRNGFQLAGVLSWFWQKGYSYEFSERLRYMLSRESARAKTIERARALNAIGFLHWTLSNFVDARPCLEEALAIGRNHEDKLTLGWTLSYLGFVLNVLGENDAGRLFLEECVAITKGFGNIGNSVAGIALSFLGDIYLVRNDEDRALEHYEESAELLRQTYNTNILGYAVRRLGYLALKQTDYEKARTLFKESLIFNRDVGHQLGMTASLVGLAKLAFAEGKVSRAAQLFGVVEGRLAIIGLQLMIVDKPEFDGAVIALRDRLDEKILARFWAKGRAMTLEEAIEFALEGWG